MVAIGNLRKKDCMIEKEQSFNYSVCKHNNLHIDNNICIASATKKILVCECFSKFQLEFYVRIVLLCFIYIYISSQNRLWHNDENVDLSRLHQSWMLVKWLDFPDIAKRTKFP